MDDDQHPMEDRQTEF